MLDATPYVRSVNIGAKVATEDSSTGVTGIAKRPVDQIELRAPGPKRGGQGSGVVGDFIGDQRHHGGDFQAVYAVAREELDWWESELGRSLPDGTFGENLTTVGLDVDHAIVGERWRIGGTVVEVTGPRIPCRTFAGRMGEERWVKRFTQRGLTGAYLSVTVGGTIRQSDSIHVASQPDHAIDVARVFRAVTGDVDAMRAVVDSRCLNSVGHAELEERLLRRGR